MSVPSGAIRTRLLPHCVVEQLTKIVFLLLSLALLSPAQNISVFDGMTPAGVAPGTPAGVAALSGFEHYNAFSGGMSAGLPLYHVGGRGEAGFDLLWNFPQTWMAQKKSAGSAPFIPVDPYPGSYPAASPNAQYLGAAGAVYTRTGANYVSCGSGQAVGSTMTTIIFVTGNGTEINLVDQATNGAAYTVPNACSSSPGTWDAGRGTAFHSMDGSMLQFTADAAVLETNPLGVGNGTAKISGTLQLPNGTTYRIDNSTVSWIRDRNGNKITLDYTNGPLVNADWYLTVPAPTRIMDSLNRVISINYNDSSCSGCTTVTYPGSGGASRVIQIQLTNLSNGLLRSGYSISPMGQLFPQGFQTSYNFDPVLARAIQLPDGSQYTFQYDSYGEVARVNLPTGGAVEYDYGDGHNGSGDGFEGTPSDANPVMIYRRLQERREYASGGSTMTSRTHYAVSYPGSTTADTETTYDASGNVVAKIVHTMNGSPLDTLQMSGTGCNAWNEGLEAQIDWGAPNPVRTVKYTYQGQSGCQSNPQLTTETTVLDDTNQVSQTTFGYDPYNNVTDKKEYDWGNGTSGPLLRDTQTTYLWASNQAYAAPSLNLVRAPLVQTIYDGNNHQVAQTVWHYDESSVQAESGIIGHDDAAYGPGFTLRANLTSHYQWSTTINNYVGTFMSYDVAGNVLSVQDANGHKTSFNFADGQNTYGFPEQVTNALGQSTSLSYDFGSGKVITSYDLNGVGTTYSYNDPLDRLVQVRRAAGGGSTLESQTNYTYPNTQQVNTRQDQNTTGDGRIGSATIADGFGRTVDSVQYEDSSQIEVHTVYNALGQVASTSNPARPGDSLLYTITSYDTLGRVTQVQGPDGSVTNTSYSGNQTTVTDPAGKNKTYSYDALGRLLSVYEDTESGGLNYATNYGYDVLGNLLWVSQGFCPNCQGRNFTYDSLSRLTSATNPESGTVSYTYDNAGNLQTKTDARNVTTSYGYDALNRLTSKTYSDGTPSVSYSYDANVLYGVGHLTSVANAAATTAYTAFDALGRVTASQEAVAGQGYQFAYTYNLADDLVTETYPSGRVVTTGYDAANRETQVTGTFNGQATNYVSGINYAAQGAPSLYAYGNNLYRSYSYNSRLQVSSLTDAIANNGSQELLNIGFNWGGTNNNGNLLGVTQNNGGPGYPQFLTFQQSFGYDGVNRLTSASDSGGWSRGFNYDSYGNMWVGSSGGVPLSGTTPTSDVFNGANRINGGNYDAAGNQTLVNGDTMAYDAENRLVSVTEPAASGGGTETVGYDGMGERVLQTMPSGSVVSVYDAFGQLVAEYSTAAPSTPLCQTCYLSGDQLGSTRLVTDANGNIVARHDFAPFGEEIPGGYAGRDSSWSRGDGIKPLFTGQIRDQETGLDYFHARYFGSALGRFTSPDPSNAGADPSDPQTWNAYSYVRNNPLTLTDPSGECFWCWFAPVLDVVAVLTAQPEIFGFTAAVTSAASASTIATAASIGASAANTAALASSLGSGGHSKNGVSSSPSLPLVSSFPVGEMLGMSTSMGGSAPLGPTGIGANGFQSSAAIEAGTRGGTILIDLGLGTLCVGSGVCEILAAGAVAIGAGAYIIYRKVGARGKTSDPHTLPKTNPGRGPDGKCLPCPEAPPEWQATGDAHGSTTGIHWHWLEYNQNPATCECHPIRRSSPNKP